VPFSLATIILEHFLDIPTVFAIFVLTALVWPQEAQSGPVVTYGLLTLLVAALSLTAVVFSRPVKAAARAFCGLFNQRIKYILLFFIWGGITVFRNVLRHSKKSSLFLYTGGLWLVYALSYFLLARAVVAARVDANFPQIFTLLFSNGGFSLANQLGMFDSSRQLVSMTIAYNALSLVLLSALSFWPRLFNSPSEKGEAGERIKNLLPWVSEDDCLRFLESYFSVNPPDTLGRFIATNRDVRIIRDFSTGSKATTMLCMNESATFYRKCALGEEGDKLYEQLKWLRKHERILPLPAIIHEQYQDGYCVYDMEYHAQAVTMFDFIHSNSPERIWPVLESAINCLRETLHKINLRPADPKLALKYIRDKVCANLKKIEAAKDIRPLLEYDTLLINGEPCPGLTHLKQWLEERFLLRVFADDTCADIHGDFTVENLIYFESGRDYPFYYIDPNTGNLHDSPALDYAKLLQSLHGGYEFLMYTDKVSMRHNEISFLAAGSKRYADLYSKYHQWLRGHFSFNQVRSIYFHEIVHWLRLLPYKIEKDGGGAHAVLFYAGLLKVLSETVKLYGGH